MSGSLSTDGNLSFGNNRFYNSKTVPRIGVGTNNDYAFLNCTIIVNDDYSIFYQSQTSEMTSGSQRVGSFSGVINMNNVSIDTIGLTTENSNVFTPDTFVYLFKKNTF